MTKENKNEILAQDTGKRIEVKTTTIRRPKETPVKEEPIQTVIEIAEAVAPIKIVERVKVESVEFDETGDFASLLNEMAEIKPKLSLNVGDRVVGKVIHIGDEHAFLSLGPKTEGAISVKELKDKNGNFIYKIGDNLSAFILSMSSGIFLSNEVAQNASDISMIEEAKERKLPIEGKVLSLNKGGFEISLAQKRAFCPISQMDDKFVSEPESFIGKNLHFLVEKVEEGGKNIVLNRRVLLERKSQELAKELFKNLEIGDVKEGKVSKILDFGAFVDIGGIEGLVPKSEITFGHLEKVSDILVLDQKVKVMVIFIEKNEENIRKSKITLSIKKTESDPYMLYFDRIKEGASLEGKVVRIEKYGAFVELFPGIDGLIHVSELPKNQNLTIFSPVTVRVISVDREHKKISLSLREEIFKDKAKSEHNLVRGSKVSGVISRIEPYGIFITLKEGVNALIPKSEILVPFNSIKIGDSLEALIIEVDEKNRLKASLLALKQKEEADSFEKFKQKEEKSMGGFGQLAGLLKNKNIK